jgi:ATP-dependent HslUV protease ATP-binding subunit HslU
MEKVMEDISFSAPNVRKKNIVIDRAYVQKQLKDIVEDEDLSRFIL